MSERRGYDGVNMATERKKKLGKRMSKTGYGGNTMDQSKSPWLSMQRDPR